MHLMLTATLNKHVSDEQIEAAFEAQHDHMDITKGDIRLETDDEEFSKYTWYSLYADTKFVDMCSSKLIVVAENMYHYLALVGVKNTKLTKVSITIS